MPPETQLDRCHRCQDRIFPRMDDHESRLVKVETTQDILQVWAEKMEQKFDELQGTVWKAMGMAAVIVALVMPIVTRTLEGVFAPKAPAPTAAITQKGTP